MRKLGSMGFSASGHGVGFGAEDFNMINEDKDLYLNFCDKGRSCKVNINSCKTYDKDGYTISLFEGTIGKAIKFIEKKY